MTDTALTSPKQFGESLGNEPEPTEVVGLALGPGIIGQKQYEFNKRHASQTKGTLGPQLSLTPQEWDAYVKAGSPKNWHQWRDQYHADRATQVLQKSMHARGRAGRSDVVLDTL